MFFNIKEANDFFIIIKFKNNGCDGVIFTIWYLYGIDYNNYLLLIKLYKFFIDKLNNNFNSLI